MIALCAILVLAAGLRFWGLKDLPAGFYLDEAGNGYNAYSILHTGRDENGNLLPMFVWSFGQNWKDPVFIYSSIVPIELFGLDERSVRATSAFYGTLAVAAVAFAGAELFGVTAGLAAGAFLAVQPWHLHFSRIAFELICFPALFLIGLAFARRALREDGWRWHAAALFLGLCPYAYAHAKIFVPMFLLCFIALYRPWRARWALLTLVLVSIPWIVFDLMHYDRAGVYIGLTSIAVVRHGWADISALYLRNYAAFLGPTLLFRHGDDVLRHSVRGWGELLPVTLPFLLLGLYGAVRRGRDGWLLLAWLLIFPLAPAMQYESPSASRGIIGAPAFALLAGLGFAELIRLCRRLPRAKLGGAAALVATAATAALLMAETLSYWNAYRFQYPKDSAANWSGFQYGYRDVIHYMESQRAKYGQLLLSATETNQPYIFTLFYAPMDPATWLAARKLAYRIVDPGAYGQYALDRSTLYALRPRDLLFFSDYHVDLTVKAPGGTTEYLVASVQKRKTFMTEWLLLGLFDNTKLDGPTRNDIDLGNIPETAQGKLGEVKWQYFQSGLQRLDFNEHYARVDTQHLGNPEYDCAYLAAFVHSERRTDAYLSLNGTDDPVQVWLNKTKLTSEPLVLADAQQRRPVVLDAGWNELIIKSCELTGYWWVQVHLGDVDDRDLPGVTWTAKDTHWRHGSVRPYDGVSWEKSAQG